MSVILIRHGKTAGNLEGRYNGARTDEPLLPEGAEELKKRHYPPVSRVIISPMLRCRQTAAILYPDIPPEVCPDLRECDFGEFEGKSYRELNGRPDYQAWIDSGGTLPFPGGESLRSFADRCARAFADLRPELWKTDTAVIAHGGTLMALMSAFAQPRQDYFSYQVKNGEGFLLRPDGSWEKLIFA